MPPKIDTTTSEIDDNDNNNEYEYEYSNDDDGDDGGNDPNIDDIIYVTRGRLDSVDTLEGAAILDLVNSGNKKIEITTDLTNVSPLHESFTSYNLDRQLKTSSSSSSSSSSGGGSANQMIVSPRPSIFISSPLSSAGTTPTYRPRKVSIFDTKNVDNSSNNNNNNNNNYNNNPNISTTTTMSTTSTTSSLPRPSSSPEETSYNKISNHRRLSNQKRLSTIQKVETSGFNISPPSSKGNSNQMVPLPFDATNSSTAALNESSNTSIISNANANANGGKNEGRNSIKPLEDPILQKNTNIISNNKQQQPNNSNNSNNSNNNIATPFQINWNPPKETPPPPPPPLYPSLNTTLNTTSNTTSNTPMEEGTIPSRRSSNKLNKINEQIVQYKNMNSDSTSSSPPPPPPPATTKISSIKATNKLISLPDQSTNFINTSNPKKQNTSASNNEQTRQQANNINLKKQSKDLFSPHPNKVMTNANKPTLNNNNNNNNNSNIRKSLFDNDRDNLKFFDLI